MEDKEEKKTLEKILEKNGIQLSDDDSYEPSDLELEKEVDFDFDKNIEASEKAADAEFLNEEEEEPAKVAKKIDLSKIKVLDSTMLDKEQDLRAVLYGGKTASQIVAAQSGYMAKVTPLVQKDVVSLLNSNLSRYEYRKAVFKVIYDKTIAISSYPAGKPSFEEWLKSTSVEDIETFYYGIYTATFPDKGKFTYTCPNCGSEHTINVDKNSLLKTANKDEMKKRVKNITKNSLSKEAMLKYSLLGHTDGFELTDSGIIAEIRTPSLWDSLELLRVVPESVIERNSSSVTNMLYIKRFLLPAKGRDGYTDQTNPQNILEIIDNLSIDDAVELLDAVSNRVDENRITYSIKNITCPVCGFKADETPISIEDILFTAILERAQ